MNELQSTTYDILHSIGWDYTGEIDSVVNIKWRTPEDTKVQDSIGTIDKEGNFMLTELSNTVPSQDTL